MSGQAKSEQRLSTISSRNHLLINNDQDGIDLAWILSKKIKSEHETQLIKRYFLKLPFFEEMQKYFGEDLMGRLFIKTKYLQKEGSCSNEMFIILAGKVIIKQENTSLTQEDEIDPYQEELNTQIEKFMSRQDLYRKFIKNRKHQLEDNYQSIVKKRQELIEENEKRIKEKEEWEQQKIQWGLVVKHQNRRKFSIYSKRDNTQIDLSNPLIFQNNYNDDGVQDSLLKVYTENSTKRGRKKRKNEGFQGLISQQVRNSASGGHLVLNQNLQSNQQDESSPKQKVIKVIEQGDYFGQNSLQENKIQLYSAVAATMVTTAIIQKSLFEEVLFSFFEKNLQKEISFLKDISLFSSLKQYELDYIHMQISSKVLEKNAFVYKKGDLSEHLFIILDGEVEIAYVKEDVESSNSSSNDILLNSNSPQKKEYPVARLGKGAVFGESELLKNTERKSEVKALSQKVHLYQLPKQKPEFKEELELQRSLKSQYRKKRIDQLKSIEKDGEIRKNQIKYQLQKSKQIGNTEDPINSQRKLQLNGSHILPMISNNQIAKEVNKSLERDIRYNTIQLEDDAFEKNLVEQQSDFKLPLKKHSNEDNLKAALNKYGSIDFNDNRLYDFCQPKYGSVNNVQIHPSKLLPRIQLSFDQISHSIEQKSLSYRNHYSLSKVRQPNQQSIDAHQLQKLRNQANSFRISNVGSSNSIDKNVSFVKQSRSYSLNKQQSQPNYQQQLIELNKSIPANNINNTQSFDYGYDMPFENAYIKKQISNHQQNQINSPQIQDQKYQKFLPIYETVVHNNNNDNKRNSSIDQINSPQQNFQHRNSLDGLKNIKSTDISNENNLDNQTNNYQIPISSNTPQYDQDNFEQDDDLSLQGEAYTYLKKIKKIPDHHNNIPNCLPKIDPLRPKDKQIFVRKPMLIKQKKKDNLIKDEQNSEPQFFERSIQYQNSVMNMLNYERQRALHQINIENSLQKQNTQRQLIIQ